MAGAKIGTFEWPISCANTTTRAEPFAPDVPCIKDEIHILGHGSDCASATTTSLKGADATSDGSADSSA
jgi:hypothetical protein